MAAGFGLGFGVTVLTVVLGAYAGAPRLLTVAALCTLTAGAMLVPPRDSRRVRGVLLGIGTTVVVVYGAFAVLLSTIPGGSS